MITNIAKAKQLGYWFSPPETVHAPGGNRLDIVLHEASITGTIWQQKRRSFGQIWRTFNNIHKNTSSLVL